MRVRIWLNEHPDHYFGYVPTHDPDLHEATVDGWAAPDGPDVWYVLDTIFAMCNGHDPQSDVLWYVHGYRSLSVGDVVALATDGGWQAFTCDPVGWSRLDELPRTPVQLP